MPTKPTNNARNYWGQKELTNRKTLVVLDDAGELRHVVQAMWWMARRSDGASPVYCSLWCDGADVSGYGRAQGYGYHKESAAFGLAVRSAGIELANNVEGVGDSAVVEAMHAIANACGYANNHIRTVV